MIESASTLEQLTTGYQGIIAQIIAYLPTIAVAITVLVLGWLLARFLRVLTVRAIGRLDLLWQRLISKQGVQPPRHPPVRIIGEVVFWITMLITITLSTEILGMDIFGNWLKEIVSYLPLAIAGLLIMLVGFVVSTLARDLISSAATSAELSHGDLLGRIAQIIILVVAIIIGVDQIGIDIAFLSMMSGIVLAAVLGSIALAFGLGARTHVSNIIAANQLRQLYQLGDKVRIGDIEGIITDITISRVIVESELGSVDVPAKLFDEEVTIITEKGV